ncbi:GON-4-like protein [Adelges cooleyi]|uniref:GON-4-like protein n=1 Tax=Adelges cooleyi TaxID=133065 RepID=UPI0021808665|nr:GON-4-like protein [Adelges cooleyi]
MEDRYSDDLKSTAEKELEMILRESDLNSSVELLDKTLTDKAHKSQLTKKNVKNLIKNVLTNDDVATMLRQTLDEDCDANCLYEPKLTRAKIREMLKTYPPSVHQWSPNQQQSIISECRLLIEQEFPDDSEDEEYQPDKNLDEEDEEDDDDESKCTEVNKSFDTEGDVDNDCENSEPIENNSKETIGMRTRSKFSLSDTPLEIIEQAFIPPDITEDMYDSACENDEWMEFLSEFTKPLDSGQNDDAEDDPEYNVLCDDDFTNVDKEEFRIDKSVKVTRKEYNDLMNELYEFTESYTDFNDSGTNKVSTRSDCDKDVTKSKSAVSSIPTYTSSVADWSANCDFTTYNVMVPINFSNAQFVDRKDADSNSQVVKSNTCQQLKPKPNNHLSIVSVLNTTHTSNAPAVSLNSTSDESNLEKYISDISRHNVFNEQEIVGMLPKQMLVFQQQLTQHVQLLTQHYVLCTLDKPFNKYLRICNKMLESIKNSTKDKSYVPVNVNSSGRFINDWNSAIENEKEYNNLKDCEKLSFETMRFMLSYYEPVFVYPELLPTKTFCLRPTRMPITPAEEKLLLLKINYVYKSLKEKQQTRAKYRKKDLADMMPMVLKTVHKRWFSHRRLTDLKIFITRHKNTLIPNNVNSYFKNGKIEDVVHIVNVEALASKKCLFENDVQKFPSIWKPTLKQLLSSSKPMEKNVKIGK